MNYNTNKQVFIEFEHKGMTVEVKVTNCNFDYSYDSGDCWTPPSSEFELIDVDFEIHDFWDAEGNTVNYNKDLHAELMPLVHEYVDINWWKFENND